jgi:hypothetical protein
MFIYKKKFFNSQNDTFRCSYYSKILFHCCFDWNLWTSPILVSRLLILSTAYSFRLRSIDRYQYEEGFSNGGRNIIGLFLFEIVFREKIFLDSNFFIGIVDSKSSEMWNKDLFQWSEKIRRDKDIYHYHSRQLGLFRT